MTNVQYLVFVNFIYKYFIMDRYILQIIVCFAFFSVEAYSQGIMEGVIVNDEANSTVANVNITTQDKRIGTSSDSKGRFSIRFPRSYVGQWLYISAIGYHKDSVRIEEKKDLYVPLTPQVYSLREVYVIPDSTLLTLLRNAYNRIPDNYPIVPTMYEGFYRESTKDNDMEQADFIEAVLSVYKDAYDKPSRSPGQIEILKSRKRKMRNTGVLYYGGPFASINSDVVLSRKEYISPRHFKKYHYNFNGVVSLGGDEFYEISFTKTSKDTARIVGTMLIEKESLAYVSFETKVEYESSHITIKHRKFQSSVLYEKEGDKWYFKHYTYSSEDRTRSDSIIYGSVDFVTTIIETDSVQPIPFERRLGFMEPTILKTDEYNSKGWTDYDDLENMSKDGLVFQFSPEESTEIFNRKSRLNTGNVLLKVMGILSKLTIEYGVSYQNIHNDGVFSDLVFKPDVASSFEIKKDIGSKEKNILLQSRTGYRLNKNIQIFYNENGNYFNKDFSIKESAFGIEYRKNIKNRGLPLFLNSALLFSSNKYFVNTGTFDSSHSFRVKGKKIDADKIALDYGIHAYTIVPQFSISSKINRFATLKLYGMYQFDMQSKDKFQIREASGFLFKKSATINAEDTRIINQGADIWRSIKIDNFQVGLSLVFGLE